MKLEGDYVFEASVDEVWSALFDPVILAAVMPGCEKLDLVDGQYVGEIKVKVGPIQGKFTGKVDLKDKDEPHSYTMVVDGRGAPGFIKATAGVKLAAEGAGTRVTYDADAQIGGKIASVGQRLIEASARAIVAQSLEGLHTNIKLRAAAYREAAAKTAEQIAVAGVAAAPIAPVIAAPGPAVAAVPAPAASVPAVAPAAAPDLAAPAVAPAAAPDLAASLAVPAVAPAAVPGLAASVAIPAPPVVAAAKPATVDLSETVPSLSQSIPIIPTKSEAALAAKADAPPVAPPVKPIVTAPLSPPGFVAVKTTQAQLANAVAKEVASSLFPRSVLVAIILIEALVIVWLLVRH